MKLGSHSFFICFFRISDHPCTSVVKMLQEKDNEYENDG
jgi:hypothetical protein